MTYSTLGITKEQRIAFNYKRIEFLRRALSAQQLADLTTFDQEKYDYYSSELEKLYDEQNKLILSLDKVQLHSLKLAGI